MATLTKSNPVIEQVGTLTIKRDRHGDFGVYDGRRHLFSADTLAEARETVQEVEDEYNHQQLCKAKWAILDRIIPVMEDCYDLEKLRAIEAILQAK